MFEVRPIAAALGAELHGVNLCQDLSQSIYSEIRKLLIKHQVIFFRDQDITPAQHRSLAESFGPVQTHPAYQTVSGFPVINGFESVQSILKDSTTDILASLLKDSYKPFKEVECLDVFTHYQAMHYLKTKQPKVMYISYGETDEWAHHANYSNYLDAANQVDAWIGDIWNWVQATPGYKNNTYIIVIYPP